MQKKRPQNQDRTQRKLPLVVWCSLSPTPVLAYLRGWPEVAWPAGIAWVLGLLALMTAIRWNRVSQLTRVLATWKGTVPATLALIILAEVVALLAQAGLALALILVVLAAILCVAAASGSEEVLRRRLTGLCFSAMSVMLSLCVLEWSLFALERSRPPNDNGETMTWGHLVRRNSLGFREREFQTPKPSGTWRIMVLGDSLTFGAGLAEEDRYSNLLERRLREQFPESAVEVLNFGMSGGPTVAERNTLAQHIVQVDPDLVVIAFCVNDPQPRDENYCVEKDRYAMVFNAYVGLHDVGFQRTAEFLSLRTDQLLRNVGLLPQWMESLDRVYQPESVEWQAFEDALADMRTISDAHAIPPPVFAALLSGNGDYNQPNGYPAQILAWSRQALDAAKRAGLTTISMEDDFKRQGYRERRVNPWDGHPDVACNVIYAENIGEAVAAHLKRHTAQAVPKPSRGSGARTDRPSGP